MRSVVVFLALLLLTSLVKHEGCMEEEREALLEIKASINSPDGAAFSSWYGENCCEWEGVECDASTFRVNKIFFRKQRRGQESISEAWYPNATLFAQFTGLQELHLPGNQIGGFTSPTALQKLKHLKKLDLHDNSIARGSHFCWGSIPTLQFIDLSKNKLHEDIPQCLCKSQSIIELKLSNNLLNGSIDACFSNLTSLKHLHLSRNLFSESFPSFLFRNNTSIESFIISHNDFHDRISFSTFANLSKLSHLDLSYCPDLEIETESPSWSPSFSLSQLRLGGCNLNSRSGSIVPSFISTQHHLQYLDLSHNSLLGSIPPWLIYNVSSELWIRGNNLSGLFPRTEKNMSSWLEALDISDNFLHGPIPEDINLIFPCLIHLNASYNTFSSSIPRSIGEMKQLQILELSNNFLSGRVPQSMKSNMTSLDCLWLSNNNLEGEPLPLNSSFPNMRLLYLDRNRFSGSFPDSLSNSPSLVILSLANNALSGELSMNFPNMRRLYLDRNRFSGSFPDSLSNSPSLVILSLANNALSGELSMNFPVLSKLRVLILRGNHLEGTIPLGLCQKENLHILDLSGNALSGEIPTCLNNITSFSSNDYNSIQGNLAIIQGNPAIIQQIDRNYLSILLFFSFIDVSSNKLTGTIPHQISELRNLQSLNMSNNFLTGQIPANCGNLTSLESLDLSRNNLFGSLPQSLTHLTFLSHFNVSFNNLSGPVPSSAQLQEFDASSFLGNHGLCGHPLPKECGKMPLNHLNDCSSTTISTLVLWCTFFYFMQMVF